MIKKIFVFDHSSPFVFKIVSYYSLARLELAIVGHIGLGLLEIPILNYMSDRDKKKLCFPGAAVKGLCHHTH